jgi:nitric oxide reductase large subunit
MRYVIFISLTCSSLQNFFPHIPLQKTTFPKKVFENKVCVLIVLFLYITLMKVAEGTKHDDEE